MVSAACSTAAASSATFAPVTTPANSPAAPVTLLLLASLTVTRMFVSSSAVPPGTMAVVWDGLGGPATVVMGAVAPVRDGGPEVAVTV